KNPLVILSDADLPLAVESTVFGAFASTGQRCTATSRVIVEESVADRFVELLVARAAKFRTGNGLDPGVDMGPAVDESQPQTDILTESRPDSMTSTGGSVNPTSTKKQFFGSSWELPQIRSCHPEVPAHSAGPKDLNVPRRQSRTCVHGTL